MTKTDARAALQRLIEERGEDYAGLSRLLGRNAAYVQQYIKRGSPRRLAEDDRRLLARYFGVDEARARRARGASRERGLRPVPRLDVGASAGAGAFDGDERAESHIAFDPAWLRRVARGAPDQLSIIRVRGDSMAPTLGDGDDILVDRGDGAERLRDGIYVLRMDDALVVKRLAVNPAARTLTIRSDNPGLSRLAGLRSRRGGDRRPGRLGRAADRLDGLRIEQPDQDEQARPMPSADQEADARLVSIDAARPRRRRSTKRAGSRRRGVIARLVPSPSHASGARRCASQYWFTLR